MLLKNGSTGKIEVAIVQNNLKTLGYDPQAIDCIYGENTVRSIADIARSEGENLKSDDTKKACIEVFALGGQSKSDDASESGYFAVRTLLARSVTEASEFLLEKTLAEEGAPALVKLIATVSTRFGIQVTEKGCGTSCAHNRRSWRGHNQSDVHGSLSRYGTWAFYCEKTRA